MCIIAHIEWQGSPPDLWPKDQTPPGTDFLGNFGRSRQLSFLSVISRIFFGKILQLSFSSLGGNGNSDSPVGAQSTNFSMVVLVF
jgi:hypothetical protein